MGSVPDSSLAQRETRGLFPKAPLYNGCCLRKVQTKGLPTTHPDCNQPIALSA